MDEAGVDDFLAEATPEDNLALIKREQEGGRLVAMTGDGTNDAPALAQWVRYGDRDNHSGVGFGLALSRGLTEAMGGICSRRDARGRTHHDHPNAGQARAVTA
ncbi:hypothetical protein [Nonomuraea sp. KM88]|uniref:hypothetical protein n=1 Tax=Nonomuraea sp. KM88 TaxID=3457427 RepID=UPI003FCE099E